MKSKTIVVSKVFPIWKAQQIANHKAKLEGYKHASRIKKEYLYDDNGSMLFHDEYYYYFCNNITL